MRPKIGIVDYGVGNINSVRNTLKAIGYRSVTSKEPAVLSECDLLLLPGVGAFPYAMKSLWQFDLVSYLGEQVSSGKPLVGICLGMQLLMDQSSEIEDTKGLGFIPGSTLGIQDANWHIGWNNLDVTTSDPMFQAADQKVVYFNHSFAAEIDDEFVCARARMVSGAPGFPVAIRHRNVVGLQFHPEKSQSAGRIVLTSVIDGLLNA